MESEYQKVKRRKKRRKKIIRRRIFSLVIVFLIVFCGVKIAKKSLKNGDLFSFITSAYDAKKVEKAKELELPSWIDKQIIHKHNTARTGIELVGINDIVIHYVGNPDTTAQNNRDYFDKNDTGVSSHFVVGLDGEIIQCVPIYERSAASNNRNKDTISIEVCHPDESGKFNEKTTESLKKLCVYLCRQFSLDENDIIRHYDVTGKICPKYFVEHEDKWDEFKESIKELLDEKE